MNAVLLITHYNADAMSAFAKDLLENQKSSNMGKLLVVGGYYLDPVKLRDIAATLAPCFEVTEITTVQVSEKAPAHTQCATMMAIFLMQRYTTVPGPWLVVDEPAEIISENPLSILEKSHNANAKDNSGRASSASGGRVAIGPVVLGAQAKQLKTLRTISGESWRQRGRWALNVATWYQMSGDDYPFRVSVELEASSSSSQDDDAPTPGDAKTVDLMTRKSIKGLQPVGPRTKPEITGGTDKAGMQPVAMPELHNEGTAEDLVEKAALAADATPKEIYERQQAAKGEGKPVAGDSNYIPPDKDPPAGIAVSPADLDEEAPIGGGDPVRPAPRADPDRLKPFMRMDASYYAKATKPQLYEQVAHRTGKKPHPQTGAPKLLAKLEALDKAEAAKSQELASGS